MKTAGHRSDGRGRPTKVGDGVSFGSWDGCYGNSANFRAVLEFLQFIRPSRNPGVQGKPGSLTDPDLERLVTGRQRLQCEDLAALLRPERDTVRDR
jgi:hypothetical protein